MPMKTVKRGKRLKRAYMRDYLARRRAIQTLIEKIDDRIRFFQNMRKEITNGL